MAITNPGVLQDQHLTVDGNDVVVSPLIVARGGNQYILSPQIFSTGITLPNGTNIEDHINDIIARVVLLERNVASNTTAYVVKSIQDRDKIQTDPNNRPLIVGDKCFVVDDANNTSALYVWLPAMGWVKSGDNVQVPVDVDNRLNDVENKVTTAETKLNQIELSTNKNTADIAKLTLDLTSLDNKVNTLETKHNQDIQDLDKRVTDLENKQPDPVKPTSIISKTRPNIADLADGGFWIEPY